MADNSQTPMLAVEQLSIGFRQYTSRFKKSLIQPIKNLSLTVSACEVVAIVGASGSGKSLLAHEILGILPHNAIAAGTIRFNGEILTQHRKESLRKSAITLIPQSVNYLDPLMRISDQVRRVVSVGDPIKRQKEVFQRYKLPESVENYYPFQLSGGMARRVLISTSSVRHPQLVIADEPTPGLDPALVNETLTNLKQLADQGAAVLMITHDVEAALQIADRIVVFYDGSTIDVVERADFTSSGERLSHPYTKKLWQSLPQNDFVSNKPFPSKANTSQPTLRAQGIRFGYNPSKPIIDNVDFSLQADEIVGLVALSGRGKTTLAKILAGYIQPQQGAVTVSNRQDLSSAYNPVQLIYQHPEQAVNPRWKLRRTLSEAFLPDREIINELGIKEAWLDRYPHELSGGELQRFCIARVLHAATKFLIADEITTMLDAISQAHVWQLILDFARQHQMGILLISHDRHMIAKLCDRIISLD